MLAGEYKLAFSQHPHARQYFFELFVAALRDVNLMGFFVNPIIALAFFVRLAR